MTLRRPFSLLLLVLAFAGGASGPSDAAATAPAGTSATAALGATDLASPSPFLAGGARIAAGLVALDWAGSGRRIPVRSPRYATAAPTVAAFDPAADVARARSTLISLFDVAPVLADARTGRTSARATALPPPHDS